jgi:hypothetical protein
VQLSRIRLFETRLRYAIRRTAVGFSSGYSLLAALDAAQRSFVIRSFQDRRRAGEDESRLRAIACAAETTLRREVPLSPRPRLFGPKAERHPARRHRIANLSFAATTVDLKRTYDARVTSDASLGVNVIHVFEKRPPKGEAAVEWFLLTNLPISTSEEIAFAVDCYRARWSDSSGGNRGGWAPTPDKLHPVRVQTRDGRRGRRLTPRSANRERERGRTGSCSPCRGPARAAATGRQIDVLEWRPDQVDMPPNVERQLRVL